MGLWQTSAAFGQRPRWLSFWEAVPDTYFLKEEVIYFLKEEVISTQVRHLNILKPDGVVIGGMYE